jgi:hypothetical protein
MRRLVRRRTVKVMNVAKAARAVLVGQSSLVSKAQYGDLQNGYILLSRPGGHLCAREQTVEGSTRGQEALTSCNWRLVEQVCKSRWIDTANAIGQQATCLTTLLKAKEKHSQKKKNDGATLTRRSQQSGLNLPCLSTIPYRTSRHPINPNHWPGHTWGRRTGDIV